MQANLALDECLLQLLFKDWLEQDEVYVCLPGKFVEVGAPVSRSAADERRLDVVEVSVLPGGNHTENFLRALETVHLWHTVVDENERVNFQVGPIQAILN